MQLDYLKTYVENIPKEVSVIVGEVFDKVVAQLEDEKNQVSEEESSESESCPAESRPVKRKKARSEHPGECTHPDECSE